MMKKILTIVAIAGLSLLTACGEIIESKNDSEKIIQGEESTSVSIENSEFSVENSIGVVSQKNQKTVNFKEAEGDWICIAQQCIDTDDNSEYSLVLYDDMYGSRYISIYDEDGTTRIDYAFDGEESSTEIYGRKFIDGDSDGYKNFYQKITEYNKCTYDLKMEDSDTLVLKERYTYSDSEYVYLYYYKKANVDLEAVLDTYRYKETIYVSNVKELYNAIGNNRKIILKEGVYDFSTLAPEDKNNPKVNTSVEYYTYPLDWSDMAQAWCMNVQYLSLEGEEGAEVEICTENGFLAPLAFYDCRHITLNNLKVGHLVEPGYCAGSVVYIESSSDFNIKNCRLYGSGTYGIESMYAYDITVDDTDIYECSNGIIYFTGTSDVKFNNCTMRDSSDLQMFLFKESSWNIEFNNCSITNNETDIYAETFIDATDAWGEINFNNCKILDNTYSTLYIGDVYFSNCTIK